MGVKYSVNENFFNVWSHEMAYVLGYIYADGSVHKSSRGSYISVSSIDKSIIQKIKKIMNSDHTIYISEPTGIGKKKKYILRIGNQRMYDSLIIHGIYPSKSLTIIFPKIPKEYIKSFVRGYFDGDGCVYLYRTMGKKDKMIIRKLSIIFTSGSRIFLRGLLTCLQKEVPVIQQKVYKSSTAYQLRFATKDTKRIYSYMYENVVSDLYLQRKYAIFQQYFSLKKKTW